MKRFLTVLAALALCGDTVTAQVRCTSQETPLECWARAEQALEPAAAALVAESTEVIDDEKAELLGKPTGVDTGGTNLATNTKNFLPFLALSGLLGDDSDGDGVYVLDLNFLIPGLAEDRNSQLQGAVNSKPTLSEGVRAGLPEETRDDEAKKLEEGLGNLDDYSLSYTFNWMDRRHGRGFQQYRNRFAALTRAVSKDFVVPATGNDQLRKFGEFLQEHEENLENVPDDIDVSFEQIGKTAGEETMKAFKSGFEAALSQRLDLLTENRKQLAEAGLGLFADLINNQPQLHFSAIQRYRTSLVGGDETSFKVTYEWGRANLNSAMSGRCHEDLDTSSTSELEKGMPETLDRCLSEFTTFVNANKDQIKNGTRFSFAAEYLDIKEQKVDLPDQGITGLTLQGAKKVIVSAGWSQLFGQNQQGQQPLRLDFVGKYEDVSDDPTRRDRGVATLTITRQFGELAVPFGIVYATHGEFLPEVDERLSAHLGLKFNLFPPSEVTP